MIFGGGDDNDDKGLPERELAKRTREGAILVSVDLARPLNPDHFLFKTKPKTKKVAIITGAGQGLGAAAAHLFASHGARVLVADLDGEKAKSVAAEITSAGVGKAAAFAGDVTDAAFAPACVRAALDAFGAESIDILVNNAGASFSFFF